MNIKKTLSDFGSWIFYGLTFIGFLLIYTSIGGKENGNTNWSFMGIGFLLIIPSIILLIKMQLTLKKYDSDEKNRIKKLMKTGDKLDINLDDLEVQTNSYQQEISVGGGYRQRNEIIDVNHNVILIDIPYRGELIKYKLNIDMDTTKLKMHLAVKKKTEFYIDNKNLNNNYLDLKFLE